MRSSPHMLLLANLIATTAVGVVGACAPTTVTPRNTSRSITPPNRRPPRAAPPVTRRPPSDAPRVQGDRILLPRPLRFQRPLGRGPTDPWRLHDDSVPMLDAVARLLLRRPGIRALEIQGHTHGQESSALAAFVSSRGKARAVLRYLLVRGVAAQRLHARGYGADRPRCRQATTACRRSNDRVELRIVAQLPRPTPPGSLPVRPLPRLRPR